LRFGREGSFPTDTSYRKSDLYRFIDLLNQGIIDQLFIGKEVETHWEPALSEMLANAKTAKQ